MDPKIKSPEKDTEVNTTIKESVSVSESEPETSSVEENESKNIAENVLSESTHHSKTSKDSPEVKENRNSEIDESNLHYENGICIYTEPESKCQYVWDEGKQEWVSRDGPDSFSDKDYQYDGDTYTYTDKETNIKYTWDEEKKEWKVVDDNDNSDGRSEQSEGKADETKRKNPNEITTQDMTKGCYSYENDTHIYTDSSDGTKYFWDKEKSAWFPRVDDDFLAQYQMNYGFVDPNANDPKPTDVKEQPSSKETENLKRKAPQEPSWFEVGEETTKVYVTGLPLDITETEFVDLMQKCGLVMRDVDSGKMKVKLYLDPETSLPKGDALCTYIKKESVELALDLLDGSDLRGHRIQVERAKFTMKGQYDPSLKPKKKRKKDKEKLKKMQEKLFAWQPDKLRGERSKHEKIVIVKNLFEPTMFNKDVKLILEYQQDLRDECLKCGAVKKVTIFDRHPEGVAQINFKEFEAADACVQLLNGRWFGQRKIVAELWDGKTKYKITETDEEIKARLAKWEKFLETGEAEDKNGSTEKETKEGVKEENESEKVKGESESEKVKGESESEKVKGESESEKVKGESESEKIKGEGESEKKETENIQRDSDGDTRSSVGSDYDTDDEAKT